MVYAWGVARRQAAMGPHLLELLEGDVHQAAVVMVE